MFSRGLCSGFDDDDGVVIASSESRALRITRSGRAAVAVWSVCPCTAWMSCSVRGQSCRLRSSEPDATLLNVDSRKSSDDWVRWRFHFTQTHAQFYTAWGHVTDPSDVEDALHKLPDKIQTVIWFLLYSGTIKSHPRSSAVLMTVVWSAEEQRRLWEEEEEVRKMKQLLEDLEKNVTLDPERNPVTPTLMVEIQISRSD